jgi:hypothetical protein
MTLQEVLNTIPDYTIINVGTDYDVVDDNNWFDYNNCEVTEIVPQFINSKVSLRINVEMPKVMPCELSHMAMIRALYEYIYCIKEEYVDFEPDADMSEMIADMHSFWGNSDYTIDHTGRWYDEDGDRIF